MQDDPLVWQRVEWRQGDGRYRFEIAEGGLLATLTGPGERSLTLPMVAWDGLLDALTAARKTRARGEREQPARAGQVWSPAETDRLIAAFEQGASIAKLAAAHNRTGYAIETKLARLGLWDHQARAPVSGHAASPETLVPKDWPPRWPPEPSNAPGPGPTLFGEDNRKHG